MYCIARVVYVMCHGYPTMIQGFRICT